MKKRFLFFSIVFLLVLSLSFVLGSFEIGNPESSLEYSYGPEGKISGWINMSFEEESVNNLFSGIVNGKENNKTLKEILENTQGYSYNCDNEKCNSYYVKGNSFESGSFRLGSGDSKLVGFYLSQNIKYIENISFDVGSDAFSGCDNQIEIDLFDDGNIDFVNKNSASGTCGVDLGCFENVSEEDYIDSDIGDIKCQRITFPTGPSFKIGAFLKKGSGEGNLTASIYDTSVNPIEEVSCDLDESSLSESEFKEVSCLVDFSVSEPTDYYVCIENFEQDAKNDAYKIKFSNSEKCGFDNIPPSPEIASYSIFMSQKKFGTPNFQIRDSNGDLSIEIEDYINEITNNTKNCSGGCIIPMKIKSNVDVQEITLDNLLFEYSVEGASLDKKKFNYFSMIPAKVNASFGKIPLSVFNLTAPKDSGEFDFVLEYEGEEIINEDNLSVRNVTDLISISPKKTAVAYPTKFILKTTSTSGIVNFKWDFGDNTSDISSKPYVEHTYNYEGNYTLEATAVYGDGTEVSISSKINVGIPDEIISEALSEKKSKLNSIKSDISGFGFSGNVLRDYLDIEGLSSKVGDLEKSYESNRSDKENLKNVLFELLALEIPQTINKIKSSESSTFVPKETDIDVEAVAKAGGGNFSDEEAYRNEIVFWNLDQLNSRISFNRFSIEYSENYSEEISIFKLDLDPSSSGEKYYVFFEEGMFDFVENYSSNSIYNYDVLELEGEGDIGFYTKQDISFSEIPVFFSPPLSELKVIEGPAVTDTDDENKWGWLVFIFIGLIILGIVGYVFLQKWYDKKYENYLFKDRNQLYNLINYVNSSKQKAMTDEEIKKKLKKVGWKGEQINYVLKKYAGKNTGLKKLFSFGGGKKKLKQAKQKQRLQQQGRLPQQQRAMR